MPDQHSPPAERDPRQRDYVRPEYIRAAAELPDPEEGLTRVKEVVAAGFEAEYGAERQALQDRETWIDQRLRSQNAQLEAVEAKIADEPEYRQTGRSNADREGGGDRIEIPFSEFQRRDQLSMILCFVAAFVLLGTSLVSVAASIRESQLPIFINNEALAWLLAFLAPATSIAVKSVSSIFATEAAKANYRKCVYGLSGVFFVGWLILFAWLFKSLSGEEDLLAEPDHIAGFLFAFLQIATEVTTGAALFLNVDAIFARYSPDYTDANSKKQRLIRRQEDLVAEINALEIERGEVRPRLAELAGILSFNLKRAELAYGQARARRTDGLV